MGSRANHIGNISTVVTVLLSVVLLGCGGIYSDVRRNRYDRVEKYIKEGGDVNVNVRGGTLLVAACQNGYPDLVKLLVDSGADLNQRDMYGATPLIQCISYFNLEGAKYLVKKGALLDEKGMYSRTALIISADYSYVDGIRLLAENGAQLDTQDWQGLTALTHAAQNGCTEGVEILLRKGADPNIADQKGVTALQYAEQGRHAEVVRLLKATQGK